MSTPAAFLGVILIWSTTPLAIKWSSEGPGFLFGVTGRMALGTVLCLALIVILRSGLPWHREARRTYVAAGVGIFGAMLSVYWGSQFIPSGWISVMYGLTPVVTSVLAAAWLNERALSVTKLAGMGLGLAGLLVIFGSGLEVGVPAVIGLGAVLLSVLLHAVSMVWVKRIGASLPALSVTGGGLLLALPFYLLTWAVLDGSWPETLPARAVVSILYLGVVGSVVGFFLFYYVLRRVGAGQVALITLITPVLALLIGNVFNGEPIDALVWLGTGFILLGLASHQWGERVLQVTGLTIRRG